MPNDNTIYDYLGYALYGLFALIVFYYGSDFSSQTNTGVIENSLAITLVSDDILQKLINDDMHNMDTVVKNLKLMHEFFITGENITRWWHVLEERPLRVYVYKQWCKDVLYYQHFALLPEHFANANELIAAFQKFIDNSSVLSE